MTHGVVENPQYYVLVPKSKAGKFLPQHRARTIAAEFLYRKERVYVKPNYKIYVDVKRVTKHTRVDLTNTSTLRPARQDSVPRRITRGFGKL